MNMALALMAKAFKLNYSTSTNNNQRISSNPRNRQIAQPGMNMGQDRQIQMVGGNGGNQFRQYAGQNVGNPAGYNDVIGNQIIHNVFQNPRVQNAGNQNGLIGVQGNGNQNQIGNGNLVAAAGYNDVIGNQIIQNVFQNPRVQNAGNQNGLIGVQGNGNQNQIGNEYDLMAAAADLDKIEEVNANCILMANLQQASTSGTQTDSAPVYDTDGSAELVLSDIGQGIFFGYHEISDRQMENTHRSLKFILFDKFVLLALSDIEQGIFFGYQEISDRQMENTHRSTARPDDDTSRPDVSIARQELSIASPTTTPTTTTIHDDEEMTLADTLIKLKYDKAKAVAFKDLESVLEEPESTKKMNKSDFDDAQIARDEEIARQLEVELQAEGKYTEDERAKLLAEYFERRKKQFPEERVVAIRNKPPTKIQLRSLMMNYLKTWVDFVPIGSEEDERMIRDMNKQAKEESSDKGVDIKKKRKAISRMKKMSKRQKTDVDLEEEEKLKAFLKIDPDEEGIIDYEVLDKIFPIINWESKFYHYDRHGAEGICYRIFRCDGSSTWIKTFSEMVTRFDRLDLVELYNLNQEEWSLKSWNFYENSGVYILILEDGTEIHMLVETRYPLTTRTLKRMLSLRLIAESASDVAYDLLRFIQKHIDDLEGMIEDRRIFKCWF
nr:hypothetical protein [Tanacetum cinerariifolium]